MSIEAINWALNHPPSPPTARPPNDHAERQANHAGPDGAEAFLSVERLTTYTCCPAAPASAHSAPWKSWALIRKGNLRYRDAWIEHADHRLRSATWS